jgi:hypothetical protein
MQAAKLATLSAGRGYHLQEVEVLNVLWQAARQLPPPPLVLRPGAETCSAIRDSRHAADAAMTYALHCLDTTRPLILDLGCGFGSFVRGIASEPPGRVFSCGEGALSCCNCILLAEGPCAFAYCPMSD